MIGTLQTYLQHNKLILQYQTVGHLYVRKNYYQMWFDFFGVCFSGGLGKVFHFFGVCLFFLSFSPFFFTELSLLRKAEDTSLASV